MEIKESLERNLWQIINKKAIIPFSFKDYLLSMLSNSGQKVGKVDMKLIKIYSNILRDKYSKTLEELSMRAPMGNILDMEKYVKKKVNGTFKSIIKRFLFKYESTQENKYERLC